MEEAIRNFAKQFSYKPEIKNSEVFRRLDKYIVVGMGGSHLAADLIKKFRPQADITIHKNYGLPSVSEKTLEESTVIASSYSGNTEEVIGALLQSIKKGLNIVVVTTGGKLAQLAKVHSLAYIQIPDTGIQPRSAMGYEINAFLKILGEESLLEEAHMLEKKLDPNALEEQGEKLAEKMRGFVPVIYSSTENESIAYNWKIKCNETGKIPAFYNVFPELNHNEMTGFDIKDATKDFSKNFYFIFIEDKDDNPRIAKRMDVLERQYRARNFNVEIIPLAGESMLYRTFSSLLLADWTALYTAKQYKLEPEQVPMIEEFKKLIAEK